MTANTCKCAVLAGHVGTGSNPRQPLGDVVLVLLPCELEPKFLSYILTVTVGRLVIGNCSVSQI